MIYHIAFKKDWEEALLNNFYKTDSLGKEGFVHCSPLEKIEEVANNFYKCQDNLVLLCIKEAKVKSKIVWEDLYRTNFKFPHIYGEINLDAIENVFDFSSDENGLFKFPET